MTLLLGSILCGGLSACGGDDRPSEPGNADAIYEQRQERSKELGESGGNAARQERLQARRAERFKAGDKTADARERARGRGDCYPSYEPCIPPPPPDLDCADEEVEGQVSVSPADDDPHDLDRDGNGSGCETYALPAAGRGGGSDGGGEAGDVNPPTN